MSDQNAKRGRQSKPGERITSFDQAQTLASEVHNAVIRRSLFDEKMPNSEARHFWNPSYALHAGLLKTLVIIEVATQIIIDDRIEIVFGMISVNHCFNVAFIGQIL